MNNCFINQFMPEFNLVKKFCDNTLNLGKFLTFLMPHGREALLTAVISCIELGGGQTELIQVPLRIIKLQPI